MATRTTRASVRARRASLRDRARSSRGGRPARVQLPPEYQRKQVVWLVVNALLSVVLVAGLVVTGWYGTDWYRDYQIRQGHKAATAAARQVVVDFLTISAKSVTKDINQVLDGSTGEFKKQYQAGMSDVRTAVVQNKVTAKGKALRSGVVSGDSDSAVVIVAVDATIENVNKPKGRKAHYRVRVNMVYRENKGRWLVSRLDFVG